MAQVKNLIAESYFQKLLHETPATEAVTLLSQFWMNRLDKHSPRFGLLEPEYHVQLILIYVGEVGNGGHSQFFLNQEVETVSQTANALRNAKLADMAAILEAAGDMVKTTNLMDLSKSTLKEMENLDRKVWMLLPDIDEALLNYLKAAESAILRPERQPSDPVTP